MLLSVAVWGVLLVYVNAQSFCPEGWVSNVEACYHISRDTEEWVTAEDMCKQYGAYLVKIETLAEDIFLSAYLRNFSKEYNDQEYWIGLSDWDIEGKFVWLPERLTPTYTNWGPGEPDNDHLNQHCTIINTREHYQWYDRACHEQYSYICEKSRTSLSRTLITRTSLSRRLTPTYTNWGPGEPDNDHLNQHCTIINTREHYQWYDRACHEQYSYICEKSTDPDIVIG